MNALDPLVWSILLMVVGCVVLALEVFIPSGGVLSILSAAAFIGSIMMAFKSGPRTGFAFIATTVVVVPAVVALAFKYWPKTPMGKAFIGELPTDEDVLPDDPRRALLGRVGVVRSKMLPSGAVEIEGQIIDAVSQGQAIEPGQYVTVVEVRANRVVVRPAKENERPGRKITTEDMLSRPIEELGIESLDDPLA
jgi:membrane-bound serine protease (ClpP class)